MDVAGFACLRWLRPGAWLLLLTLPLTSCASDGGQRTTRMQLDDFEAMAAAMAESLRASEALRGRGPDSAPWRISITQVRNLSNDVMTPAEQWAIMAKIQDAQSIQHLWDAKRVRFVLPIEKVRGLRRAGIEAGEPIGVDREPTHTLTAVFRSATRASGSHRTEVYFCQFELLDLREGTPVWADRFEYKRQARGRILD